MRLEELETLQNMALTLNVKVVVSHYDINRYSVTIGGRVFTRLDRALSALSTIFLKQKKQ